MSLLKKYFYNIECDHCHALADEEMWNNEPVRDEIIPEGGWRNLGGKDYCPNCWHYDDDDNIVTADGKVWGMKILKKEIKEEMNYYTSTIPITLAEKLKKAGLNSGDNITYAEVFDWIIGQGIFISVAHAKVEGRDVCWYPIVNGKHPQAIDGRDWEHSALLAIEKALELINKD